MYLDKMGGNNYVVRIEKDISSLFNWFRARNVACVIAPNIWLAIYYRSSSCCCWAYVAVWIIYSKEEVSNYDYSSKESA